MIFDLPEQSCSLMHTVAHDVQMNAWPVEHGIMCDSSFSTLNAAWFNSSEEFGFGKKSKVFWSLIRIRSGRFKYHSFYTELSILLFL